jgi:signal transduction histidine kinase
MEEGNLELQYLRDCLKQRERELEAVRRITFALHAKTSVEDLVRDTLVTAVDTLHAAAGSVLLHDPDRDELVFRYVIGETAAELTNSRMPSGQGLCGKVFQSGEAVITLDAPRDPAHFRGFDEKHGFQTRSMVTVPLKDSEGQPFGVMQILNKQRDVFNETDLAVLEILSSQAASAIETARLYEEAKLAFVAKTIGNISHDVVNMLQPSVGGAETLRSRLDRMFARFEVLRSMPAPADPWPAIDQAAAEVQSLYPEFCQMVIDGCEDVQDRARQIVEAVRGELSPPEFQPTRVVEIVERVFRAQRLPASRRGVRLVLKAPEDLPSADLDGRGLYNALYNLVDNAIDETPPDRPVTVRLSAEPDPSRPDGGTLQIIVADTGPGIPPELIETLLTDRIFTTKPGGTGLGTKIARRVVALHHGSLQIESTPGEGTTFTIRLPLRQGEVSGV